MRLLSADRDRRGAHSIDEVSEATMTPSALRTFLKEKIQVMAGVPALRAELLELLADGGRKLHPSVRRELKKPDALRNFVENPSAPGSAVPVEDLETIVLAVGRPVLLVTNDTFDCQFEEPESQFWTERLNTAKAQLNVAIPSVGKIELLHHDYRWVGTGWVVSESVVVTNRHVAKCFAHLNEGGTFEFRRNAAGKKVQASIDFRAEHQVDTVRSFAISDVLYIGPEEGPDVAFLKVNWRGDAPSPPIQLAAKPPAVGTDVAVIGYPAFDSRITDVALMMRIFKEIYDVKRLAPGVVQTADTTHLRHDCSTLGGNSGSAVIALGTGKAVGLHFAGTYGVANHAVPAGVIQKLLAEYT